MWQPFANAQQPPKRIPIKETEAKMTTSSLYNKYGPHKCIYISICVCVCVYIYFVEKNTF